MPFINNHYIKKYKETFDTISSSPLLINNTYMPTNITKNPSLGGTTTSTPPIPTKTMSLIPTKTMSPIAGTTMSPIATPPLHHSTTPPLHHSTTPPLHHSTTPPLHHSTTTPLHHSTTTPQHSTSITTSNYIDSNNNYLSLNNANSNLELPDNMKLDLQKCSMNCCSLNQWTPFMDPNYGPITQELNYDYGIWARDLPTDFVPNNYSCDNGDKGRGCVCLSKNLMNIYANRGGN